MFVSSNVQRFFFCEKLFDRACFMFGDPGLRICPLKIYNFSVSYSNNIAEDGSEFCAGQPATPETNMLIPGNQVGCQMFKSEMTLSYTLRKNSIAS